MVQTCFTYSYDSNIFRPSKKMELNASTMESLETSGNVSNANTLELSFHGRGISRIETGVFEKYHLLQELRLFSNEITEVSEELFKSLTDLRVISLYRNKIKKLDGSIFANNRKLEYIWLHENSIEYIHPKTFFNLSQLKYLYLDANALTEFDFGCLRSSTNLIILSFSGNRLTEIDGFEKFREMFPHLKTCRLHDNRFSCSYLKMVFASFEEQKLKIEGLDKRKGIQPNSIFNIKCVPEGGP